MSNRAVSIIGTRGYPSFYGGFETLLRHLVPYLADRGWDVTVYGRPGATRPAGGMANRNIHAVETHGLESKSLSTLTYGATSSFHACRKKPDVALVMNVANGFWLPMLRSRGIPTAVNVDGIEWEREKWGRVAKTVFRVGARLTALFADEIICDSHEIARRWSTGFGRNGHFIPYGGERSERAESPRNLTPGGYVLMVARFVPENTVNEFFEAAKQISQTVDVVVVGSSGYGGPLEQRIREIEEQNERVHWYGHLSDDNLLYSLWQNAGAYFHGHSVGGTNPALVQAMACGAPIVARDTVYNREVLGNTGLFVPPDANDIARAILSLVGNKELQRKLSLSAQKRSNEAYTWELVCESYNKLLGQLVDENLSSSPIQSADGAKPMQACPQIPAVEERNQP